MPDEALVLDPSEWDDLEQIVAHYLKATAWVLTLPDRQTHYGHAPLAPIRVRRELATRIVEANR